MRPLHIRQKGRKNRAECGYVSDFFRISADEAVGLFLMTLLAVVVLGLIFADAGGSDVFWHIGDAILDAARK